MDISRAYFNAKTDPSDPTYVQLPAEDEDSGSGRCGFLRRHMYGPQKAAEGWQSECSATLVASGFVQGTACPCIFTNAELDLVVSVHGDDFTAVGPCDSLDIYEAMLEKAYELKKGGRLGPGAQDDKEASCLSRIMRWGPDGI